MDAFAAADDFGSAIAQPSLPVAFAATRGICDEHERELFDEGNAECAAYGLSATHSAPHLVPSLHELTAAGIPVRITAPSPLNSDDRTRDCCTQRDLCRGVLLTVAWHAEDPKGIGNRNVKSKLYENSKDMTTSRDHFTRQDSPSPTALSGRVGLQLRGQPAMPGA